MSGECPPILVPDTQNCSGRGVCLTATFCDCEDGWTGIGDFAFQSPTCNVNIKAIQALWGLLACLHWSAAVLAVLYLRIKAKQKTRPLGPILMGISILSTGVFVGTTAMIRATNPLRTIGSDTVVTVLFAFGTSSFWIAVNLFIFAFIDLALRQAKMGRNAEVSQRLLFHMKISLPLLNSISIIACFLPIGMLRATDAGHVQQLASAHYLLSAGELVATGAWLGPQFINRVIKEISEVASHHPGKSNKLEQIVKKLERFRTELRNQTITNVIFAVLFGFWPFLQIAGSSYFLPFAWTSGGGLCILGLYVNLPVSDKKSSQTPGEKSSSVQPGSTTMPNQTGTATNAVVTFMPESFTELTHDETPTIFEDKEEDT